MATNRQPPLLHDNLLGGAEMTLPAHLVGPNQWRTQHNMRLTPTLEQVARKIERSTYPTEGAITWIGTLPGSSQGFGKVLFLTQKSLYDIGGTVIRSDLLYDAEYRRWDKGLVLYNGDLYYTNGLNPIRRYNGSSDSALSNAPSGRYLVEWFDHLVVGYPTFQGTTFPNRLMMCDLYDFTGWNPLATNEADHYDFVEWQDTSFPFVGCTGIAKINGRLLVFTPTAIIPMSYVGKPKVFQVNDEGIVVGTGNTFPWSLATLNNVCFAYDHREQMFNAFDGQELTPIGEPVRQYMRDTLSTTLAYASMMWPFVDVDNREVVWNFCSNDSPGRFDKQVVFNYRLRTWRTGSSENIHAFCGPTRRVSTIGEMTGIISDLPADEPIGNLGLDGALLPRLYGSIRDEDVVYAILDTGDNAILDMGDDAILQR